MIALRTLGAIDLVGENGEPLDGLLRQPKRLALLCYLASPAPGAWHRRDTILAAFWPEVENGKARSALRNALYVIRQELGNEIIRTRGDEDVSVDPTRLSSDVDALQHALTQGALAEGIARYRGAYLDGFFLSEAQGFERWLDAERQRIRTLALKGGLRLAEERERAGDRAGAVAALRWCNETDPDDESTARRLIALLDQCGDRAQALVTFEHLAERLRREFESEPSRETLELVDAIRVRRSPRATADPPAPFTSDSVEERSAANDATRPFTARYRWVAGLLVLGVLGLIVAGRGSRATAMAPPTVLLVLPMENATGRAEDAYIATGLAEDLASRLMALRSFTIRSAARASWPAARRRSLAEVAPLFGTQVMLRTRLTRVGDSLLAVAQLVDAASGSEREVATEHFTEATLRDAGSQLAAAIAGAVYRVPLPEIPRAPLRTPDPDAYRLTLLGWHQLLQQHNDSAARSYFLEATRKDPLHARAWSGLSSTWAAAAVNGLIPFEDGLALAEASASRALALDSLQGTAWANLGVLYALRDRSLAAGEPYFQRGLAAEPANAELHMVYSAVLRFARQWDRAHDEIRVARQLDPLSAQYAGREGIGSMCQDHAAESLRWHRVQLSLDPEDREGHLGVARSLARLGRWDEAIAQLRILAQTRRDSALARALLGAQGEQGYWAYKHREGAALLATRTARAATQWTAPYLLGVAEIGAGNLERGLDLLEAEVKTGSRMVYKLPCNPEIDEVRGLPRFKKLLQEAGALP